MTDSRVPDLSDVQSPPRRNIDYRTIKDGDRIGSGRQAIVRRSDLPGSTTPQTVAVKEPQWEGTPGADDIEAFFEKARTWRTLDTRERQESFRDSDHIVGIVDIGDDLPWIAMEYMDGGSLKDRLADHPDGLPVEEALWIGECLCRGLKLAHDQGVAHLDLKPANVLFRKTPGETWDVPKIADWGLARVLLNDPGSMDAFSVPYAGPEQFDSDKFGTPDKYTDIYQLGAMVYELLTGDPPYTGGHARVKHDVLNGVDPAPPSTHRDTLPEAVDEVVLRALSTEKPTRYRGSVDRFEEALHTIRQGGTPTRSGRAIGNRSSSTQADSNVTSATGREPHQSHNWPMFQGGPARTGHNSETSGPKNRVTTEWTFEAGDFVFSSLAVVDGTVYIGSKDNHVYALDAADGSTQWTFEMDEMVTSSPAVVNSTVYVGSWDNHVYALNAADGTPEWTFETDLWVHSSPAVVDGTVYVGSGDGHVYALSAIDGSTEWTFETGNSVESSPAVAGGTVFVGSWDNHVYALDAADGYTQWSFETGDGVKSSPAVVDGTVYVGSYDNHIYALGAADGTTEWAFETDSQVKSSPAVADGTVYVGSKDNHVYALDAADGATEWAFKTYGKVNSSPAVADGTVYVGSLDGRVYALSTTDGSEEWISRPDEFGISALSVADGIVYVGSQNKHVYALSDR